MPFGYDNRKHIRMEVEIDKETGNLDFRDSSDHDLGEI